MIKNVDQLHVEYRGIIGRKIPRADKLPLVRIVRGVVSRIEEAAAKDFSFPLEEVHKAKALLIKLDEYLGK